MEKTYNFALDFHVHCLFETDLTLVRREEDGTNKYDDLIGDIPEGFVAIMDAEMDLVALVPDREGLINPPRRLPALIAALLSAAAD